MKKTPDINLGIARLDHLKKRFQEISDIDLFKRDSGQNEEYQKAIAEIPILEKAIEQVRQGKELTESIPALEQVEEEHTWHP